MVPGFSGATFERYAPELSGKPYALIDVAGRVAHASDAALAGGIMVSMSAHAVRAKLPECDLRMMRDEYVKEASAEFFDVLANTGLPCERIGPGAGYLDLTQVAPTPDDAREVVTDLGRQLRKRMGERLTPAIGWGDMAKAVARAAAIVAPRGTMRLVPARDAASFMAPLPVSYLPLQSRVVLQLRHLGITSCAGLSGLSSAAIKQRWGAEGVEAQRLARGEDRRPIRPELSNLPLPVEVDFGNPAESADDLIRPLVAKLTESLAVNAHPLEGITHLLIAATDWSRDKYAVVRRFGEPLLNAEAVQRVLESEVQRFKPKAPLTILSAQIMAIGECELKQLTLFGEDMQSARGVDALGEGVRVKYASILQQAQPLVVAHPIPDRRYRYAAALTGGV